MIQFTCWHKNDGLFLQAASQRSEKIIKLKGPSRLKCVAKDNLSLGRLVE